MSISDRISGLRSVPIAFSVCVEDETGARSRGVLRVILSNRAFLHCARPRSKCEMAFTVPTSFGSTAGALGVDITPRCGPGTVLGIVVAG